MDEFDELLSRVIDKTMRYCLGEENADVVYNHLEGRGVKREEIPMKLEEFSIGLRDLMGNGPNQILGFAPILEETILEALCVQVEISFDKTDSAWFPNRVRKLKEVYNRKRIENQTALGNSSPEPGLSSTHLSMQRIGGES